MHCVVHRSVSFMRGLGGMLNQQGDAAVEDAAIARNREVRKVASDAAAIEAKKEELKIRMIEVRFLQFLICFYTYSRPNCTIL